MTDSVKLGVILIVAVLAGGIVWKLLTGVISGILGIITPIAIVGGICLIGYGLISRKSLGGGKRYLP